MEGWVAQASKGDPTSEVVTKVGTTRVQKVEWSGINIGRIEVNGAHTVGEGEQTGCEAEGIVVDWQGRLGHLGIVRA